MQTKSSYRVLKWALAASVVASFVTACVVKEGDPDDIGFGDGGDGNTPTAGTKSDAGEATTGGKATGGGGSGGQSTAGKGGSGGTDAGGEPSTYVPGECEVDDPTPTSLPSCDPKDNDEGQTCKICLKSKCCDAWQTCYGDAPTSACGWGKTEEALGQFDCIQQCYVKGAPDATDFAELIIDCEGQCLNQCDAVDDGFATTLTQNLIECAQDSCEDECLPVQ